MFEIILAAQSGDEQAMLKLIEDFTPLLKKYGKKLKRDDGFEELCASFISVVHKIPLSKMESSNPAVFISYFATAVKNEYIRLSKAEKNYEIRMADLPEESEQMLENQLVTEDVYQYDIGYLLNNSLLSPYQRDILYQHFCEDKPISKIAEEYGVSRQSINHTKKRALDILRKSLLLD